MTNVKVIIHKHNKKTLNKTNKTEEQNNTTNNISCNCRSNNLCPLHSKCSLKIVINKTTISSAKETKHYIGLSGNTFKVDSTVTIPASKIIKTTGPN